jgi:putative spermidine/putrescine transport system permease protein
MALGVTDPSRRPPKRHLVGDDLDADGVTLGSRYGIVPASSASGSPWTPYWLAAPMAFVFLLFFVLPLLATLVVSFWNYNEYSIQPAFTVRNYVDVFDKCATDLPALCTTFKTYLSTLKFCLLVWAITLILGFSIAYYLAFHIRTIKTQVALALLCTIPFWTSNVIRMISWIPLLGRNGLVNQILSALHLTGQPVEWLLYSDFSIVLALVHLNTVFMIVPILNSMMRIDPDLIEAARDAGASGWQMLWNVVIPLSKSGIAIGSIFVITVVMGDFLTIGIMGGQQIASVGKTIQVQLSYLQFPIAAANSVILLATVLIIVWFLTRFVNIRREL